MTKTDHSIIPPPEPAFEPCSCEESTAYKIVLKDIESWLSDLGADEKNLGSMNKDEGARQHLANIRAVLAGKTLPFPP